jgi:hypothetical protein
MIRQLVEKSINAVEKFAGAINAIIPVTAPMIGKKDFLKSLIFSCLFESSRARNMISASLARSDV